MRKQSVLNDALAKFRKSPRANFSGRSERHVLFRTKIDIEFDCDTHVIASCSNTASFSSGRRYHGLSRRDGPDKDIRDATQRHPEFIHHVHVSMPRLHAALPPRSRPCSQRICFSSPLRGHRNGRFPHRVCLCLWCACALLTYDDDLSGSRTPEAVPVHRGRRPGPVLTPQASRGCPVQVG